jgi:hypothetical protein
LADSLPQGVVAAQNHLNPHVSQRDTIYTFPHELEGVDYVFLDISSPPTFRTRMEEYRTAVRELLNSEEWGLVWAIDGYLLFQRGAPQASPGQEFYDFLRADGIGDASPVEATFGDSIQLSGLRVVQNKGLAIEVRTYWRRVGNPEDLHIFVGLVDENGQPISHGFSETDVSYWDPPSQWMPGELIHDRAMLQIPANVSPTKVWIGVFVGPPSSVTTASARSPIVVTDATGLEIAVQSGTLLTPAW